MLKNIVFDMGGVLLRFDKHLFIARLGVAPEDEPLLMREVFGSLEWVMMDRGSIAEAEAVKGCCSRLPKRLHEPAEKLISMWDRPILPIDGVEEIVKELKEAGYGVYLLSNASLRQHEYWPRIPASKYFDGKLVSADVKLVKPQQAIYKLFCDTFSLKPEECLFIDDMPANIEGAVYYGMAGVIFYNDARRLRADLRNKGVSIRA